MAQDRDTMPSVSRIHKYWYDRVSADLEGNYILLGDNAVTNILVGKGEECYACGQDGRPQRCHILPHSCGGDESVENLFLMCITCHQDNPDTIYEDMFFHYVRHREPHINTLTDGIFQTLQQLLTYASDDEKAAIEEFNKLSEAEQLAHHLRIDKHSVGPSVNNKMSVATKVMSMWKNVVTRPFLSQPSEPAACST